VLRRNISVWLNVALISFVFISVSSLIIYAGHRLRTIETQFSDLQTKVAEAGQNLNQVAFELEAKKKELSRTLKAFSSTQDSFTKVQGSGEGGDATLAALRAAVDGLDRDRDPHDWAQAQYNLGNALERLGQRDAEPTRLLEAVTAYRAALKEWTRDQAPLLWSQAQNSLGLALVDLGARENETRSLEE
jgi:septal ring factor EnvC (AmiA/AmiB activator)